MTFGDERSKSFAEPHVIDSKIMKRLLIPLSCLFSIAIAVSAQNRMTYSVVSPDNGHVALGLAIRKLNVSGTFMQAPAHPDDETNALFALFTHGMGLRSVDVQNNRGEGGQNEIGPELFRDIGVLRTSELRVGAPHRRRGAVLHARHRLRLLVRSRGSDQQVGPRRDHRRLRAAHSRRCAPTCW